MSGDPTHIKDLTPDPNNRRKHTSRNIGMIVDSLHDVGASRSIVIDENNEVLAGNATIDAAGEAGITKVRVVDASGEEIIAVRRVGLSDAQKIKLAISDNRSAEIAEWDTEQLQQDISSGVDLSSFFYEDELSALLQKSAEITPAPALPSLDIETPLVPCRREKILVMVLLLAMAQTAN